METGIFFQLKPSHSGHVILAQSSLGSSCPDRDAFWPKSILPLSPGIAYQTRHECRGPCVPLIR